MKWLALVVGPIGAAAAIFLDYQKRHADKVNAVLKMPKKNEETLSSSATVELNGTERY